MKAWSLELPCLWSGGLAQSVSVRRGSRDQISNGGDGSVAPSLAKEASRCWGCIAPFRRIRVLEFTSLLSSSPHPLLLLFLLPLACGIIELAGIRVVDYAPTTRFCPQIPPDKGLRGQNT